MAGKDLKSFDIKAKDLTGSPEQVEVMLKHEVGVFIRDIIPKLTAEQCLQVLDALPRELTQPKEDGPEYSADFSIAEEISLQLAAVQAMRSHIFPDGRMRSDTNIREAKDVLTTCNQMIKTLMESHGRIMNMERMRAVESATVEVLIELGDDLKEKFLTLLAARLESVQ